MFQWAIVGVIAAISGIVVVRVLLKGLKEGSCLCSTCVGRNGRGDLEKGRNGFCENNKSRIK